MWSRLGIKRFRWTISTTGGDPLLLDVINERWQKVGRGVTVEVLLESQDTVDAETQLWREVANILSDRLLSIGTSFGLYLYNDDRR